MSLTRGLSLTVLIVAGWGVVAVADEIPPPVTMTVAWEGRQWQVNLTDPNAQGVAGVVYEGSDGYGAWHLTGVWTPGTGDWTCAWDLYADPDPFVFGGFNFQNNLAVPQDFSVSLAMPAVVNAPAQMRGGIAGDLLDADDDGATLHTHTNNAPIYTALIDGAPVQTLLDPYYTTSVGAGQTDDWGPPAPANFGWMPSIPVTAWIGIDHYFNLSGGQDNANFVTRFEVIPEPASLALLVLGGLALLRRQ